LRFQPANGADLDAYRIRLELLAKDCAHISPALLRAACDRVAPTAPGLPYARSLLEAAAQIVDERRRMQEPIQTDTAPQLSDNEARCIDMNLDLIRRGDAVKRWRLEGERFQLESVTSTSNWQCNGNGTITRLMLAADGGIERA
jgi:hypothetical protein